MGRMGSALCFWVSVSGVRGEWRSIIFCEWYEGEEDEDEGTELVY